MYTLVHAYTYIYIYTRKYRITYCAYYIYIYIYLPVSLLFKYCADTYIHTLNVYTVLHIMGPRLGPTAKARKFSKYWKHFTQALLECASKRGFGLICVMAVLHCYARVSQWALRRQVLGALMDLRRFWLPGLDVSLLRDTGT